MGSPAMDVTCKSHLMQRSATLCTSMPTVRRTSLRRRVFCILVSCQAVKPGGGSVMRHAYASLPL